MEEGLIGEGAASLLEAQQEGGQKNGERVEEQSNQLISSCTMMK